ncbi:MAG: hypothetical protein Ct9H300mP12_17220 [Acidimicrobiales bacterium]|nr:MAG: hypothetical protein Ct9H300mP12_17220 [Acidimicrobiales bacterium]
MAIHAGGTFLCTREAVKLMGEGGSVITVSSIAGLSGWGPVHYSSAKGAVLGFTRAASKELGGMGFPYQRHRPRGDRHAHDGRRG